LRRPNGRGIVVNVSTSSPKITRFNSYAVAAERIVSELAAMSGVRTPRFVHAPAPVRHAAVYSPPGVYRDCPNGVIRLRRNEPRGFVSLMCHEFQHHLDALAGVYCANPHSRHDPAFYARAALLEQRYAAYRAGHR
jgi:hypothetical protein